MVMLASVVLAQRKNDEKTVIDVFKKSVVVKSFRSYMKDKNYAKAKETIDASIRKYEEASKDAQLYKYEMEALNELVNVENTKIYLNSSPDTTSYFNYTYELYATGLRCDSLEQAFVQEKRTEGKSVKAKLRRDVGRMMLPYRQNLLGAGKYYYKRKDYREAFRFIDMYARTKTAEVLTDAKGNSLVKDPDDLTSVAVLAVLSAYASGNQRGVLAYLSEGLLDQEKEAQLLEIGSKAAAELGDSTEMVRLLEIGFERYPQMEYFFLTLTKYYNEHGDYEQALAKSVKMSELFPTKRDYWYMAGKEQMLLGRNEDALYSFEKCVEIKADDAESYSSIGNIYLHDAHEAYARFNVPLSDPSYTRQKAAVNELYKKACEAFEQARKFDENHADLWLSGLRESYFKLNRGKELKALERYK